MNRRGLLFLSYYGPEEAASGIRAGRLARSAALSGEHVIFLHGAAKESTRPWRDGIELRSFRRHVLPSFARPRPGQGVASDLRGRSNPISRGLAHLARSLLQPDRFVLSGPRFEKQAIINVQRLVSQG